MLLSQIRCDTVLSYAQSLKKCVLSFDDKPVSLSYLKLLAIALRFCFNSSLKSKKALAFIHYRRPQNFIAWGRIIKYVLLEHKKNYLKQDNSLNWEMLNLIMNQWNKWMSRALKASVALTVSFQCLKLPATLQSHTQGNHLPSWCLDKWKDKYQWFIYHNLKSRKSLTDMWKNLV